jgi:hypothetical protein
MWLFEKNSRRYVPYRRKNHICTHLSREKLCIYSKTLSGQGLSQETQMQSKNRFSINQVTRKLSLTERKSRRKTLQTPKR